MITVVMPTCNSAATLRATLDSVVAQSDPDWELVAVDDASTDETVAILRSYGDRVRVIQRRCNSGTADVPRAQGVEAAQTEWVALLDADDVWHPDKLARMAKARAQRPDIPLWHHYVRVIDAAGQGLYIRHEGAIPPTGPCGRELLARCFISTSAVVVRRNNWLEACRAVRLGEYGTEWDIFLAVARKFPIGFVPEVLGSYRYTTSSVSRKNWKRYSRDVVGLNRVYRSGLWRGVASRSEMRRLIRDACAEDAELHRHQGRPGRALWFCAQGLRRAPFSPNLWMCAAKAVVRGLSPTA